MEPMSTQVEGFKNAYINEGRRRRRLKATKNGRERLSPYLRFQTGRL